MIVSRSFTRPALVPRLAILYALALALLPPSSLLRSQTSGEAQNVVHERIKVHGKGLEGNLSGDSPDRDVSVYLPPSYKADSARRYPVLYLLHGYTNDDAMWAGLKPYRLKLPEVIGRALARDDTREMLVVMPNAYTRFQGSMYSTSVTTGDWEGFVAQELVTYIDSHYRTIADRSSRGLAGHSMGGYGAMRIGMKHPDVFSSIYLLSPCCMAPRAGASARSQAAAAAESIQTMEEFEKADFGVKVMVASAAAWAPNPNNPPFFLDLPTQGGEPRPEIAAKLAANAPLAMIDQYIPHLKRLTAIAFDAGDRDVAIAATIKDLDQVLDNYKIAHQFEIYEGDHGNRIAERIETKLFPFFSGHLRFNPASR